MKNTTIFYEHNLDVLVEEWKTGKDPKVVLLSHGIIGGKDFDDFLEKIIGAGYNGPELVEDDLNPFWDQLVSEVYQRHEAEFKSRPERYLSIIPAALSSDGKDQISYHKSLIDNFETKAGEAVPFLYDKCESEMEEEISAPFLEAKL